MTFGTTYSSPAHPAVGPPKLLAWSRRQSYWRATRHPLACLLFLLPLLIAYEVGVVRLGGEQAASVRNGADAWLRRGLRASGLQQLWLPPALLVAALGLWSWRRRADRPADLVGVCSGMGIESVVYALLLWRLSRELGPVLDRLGVVLGDAPTQADALAQLVRFVGAGIYEEALFRLGLFGGLFGVLRLARAPKLSALASAALIASIAFAAVHHVGPYGEPFNGFVFLFRTLAGVYFTALFVVRGFGIAVGAHACYDLIVGVAIGGTPS